MEKIHNVLLQFNKILLCFVLVLLSATAESVFRKLLSFLEKSRKTYLQ